MLLGSESYRFPRSRRLCRAAEFQHVFSKPIKSTDKHFKVLARKNNRSYARLGLAISKKNIKKAVGRSRIRRIVREHFRLHQKSLCGLDVVVIAHQGADLASHRTLWDSLERHWKRLISQCDSR